MITTVMDCVSNSKDDNDSEMTSIGFIAEYVKGNSQYRERVNLVVATTDNVTALEFEPGSQYIVTFTKRMAKVVGETGDVQEKS